MKPKHTAPAFMEDRFNCPHCHVYAQIRWKRLHGDSYTDFYQATCISCSKDSLWMGADCEASGLGNVIFDQHLSGQMLYPLVSHLPLAHPDMPACITREYEEARQVFQASPRSAAAVLRLCVEKLCEHLLGKSGDINKQIGELVQRGLPIKAQQALDSLRIIGNHAVHPGSLNVEDRPELVERMFGLVNFIIENQITAPAAIDRIFNELPEGARNAIEKRDAR